MSILSHHDEFEDYYSDSTKKTNAEIFKQTFGIYATELWSMKEADFLKWLNDDAPTVEEKSYAMGYQDGAEDGLQGIRPKGEWKALTYHTCYCSNCHFDFDIMKCDFMTKMKFCPNCSADMRKGDKE